VTIPVTFGTKVTMLTLSTAWYVLKAKFDIGTYTKWIDNMLSNVQCNVVIYTDYNSLEYVSKYESNKIKIIIKPIEDFYNYRYKDYWIENHKRNHELNKKIGWEVNMLWSEKVHFVNETMTQKYFDTEFYGWCDIGYFREDCIIEHLKNWPNPNTIQELSKDKIYYACVNNDDKYINHISQMINSKNADGLPITPLPANLILIAGGFFLAHKYLISWWAQTYDEKLRLYIKHNYLVKDDQIILADCIFTTPIEKFIVCREFYEDRRFNNWFMFQRYLL
jgi:hypothetical protein